MRSWRSNTRSPDRGILRAAFARLPADARALMRSWAEILADKAGYELLRHGYYSPVPDVAELPEAIWKRRSGLYGLDFDPAAHMEILERNLARYIAETAFPIEAAGPGEFYLDNGSYGSVDAEVLYAMVRHHKPSRIIELGSGFSTLVINAATRRNEQEGQAAEHLIFDPYPSSASRQAATIQDAIRLAGDLQTVSATDVPLSQFESLTRGDILFVDTSHTVKSAGDVNRIVLEVLPVLQPGVVVHFHDIFLPWEYPRDWVVQFGYYWAEQYLLQAFLSFNRRYRIQLSSHAVVRAFPERVAGVVPSFIELRGSRCEMDVDPADNPLRRRVLERLRNPPSPSNPPAALWLEVSDATSRSERA
jgi:predicted O-methyltransferase YrrM